MQTRDPLGEHINRGMAANPSDSPYRLADEYRRTQALTEAEKSGRELLTSQAAMSLWNKASATVRKAVHTGRLSARFELTSSRGGTPVRVFALADLVRLWGEPPRSEDLAKMRVSASVIGIGGLAWGILDVEGFRAGT